MPFFSIIIPLYNKEDTIGRAVRSCLTQTFFDFELIVVDDGSTDESAQIVETFHDRRIRMIHQSNGGVSSARNTGILAAQSGYVTFLDADDEYLPTFLEEQKSLITAFPEASLWGTNYWLAYPSGKWVLPKIHGLRPNFRGIIQDYFGIAANSAPIFCSISVCIRRKILLKLNNFPIGVRTGEDLMTWARICAKYQCAYADIPQSVYHCFLNNTEPPRIPPKKDIVGECLKSLYVNNPSCGLRRYIALWHKIRGVNLLNLHFRKKAICEFLISLVYSPGNWKTWMNLCMAFLPHCLLSRIRLTRIGH